MPYMGLGQIAVGGRIFASVGEARPLRVQSQSDGRCFPCLAEYYFDNFVLARSRAFLHASDIVHSVCTTKIDAN